MGFTIKNKVLKIMFQHDMKLHRLLMTPIININVYEPCHKRSMSYFLKIHKYCNLGCSTWSPLPISGTKGFDNIMKFLPNSNKKTKLKVVSRYHIETNWTIINVISIDNKCKRTKKQMCWKLLMCFNQHFKSMKSIIRIFIKSNHYWI